MKYETIRIVRSVQYGYTSAILGDEYLNGCVVLGIAHDVVFKETTVEQQVQQEVQQLEAMKKAALAACQVKVEEINEKIQSLLALEYHK